METRPILSVKNCKTGEKGHYRMDQEGILLGRDRACFVVLEDKTASRRHAEILHDGGQFFLRDLKSGNGTALNGIPLPPEEKMLLKSGDRFRIGNFEFHFTLPSAGEEADFYERTDSDILEVKMVKKLLKSLDQESSPYLEVVEGPSVGQRFVLGGKKQEAVIGRDPACEFRIDSDVISRRHARLTRKWDTVQIEDLGSRNGVYVGRERIKKQVLKDSDRIHLGTVILTFRNPQELALDFSPLKKAKEKPEPPPPKPMPEKLAETTPEPVSQAVRIPFTEILMALLGFAVLIGAIWGILKVL